MLSDYTELLSILNARRVKYLVIGAYAVAIHAQPRATKDLDILVKADPENARALFAALAEFGAPLEGLAPEGLAERGLLLRMGHEPVAVDILSDIPGVDFDAAWERRVDGVIDPAGGFMAHFTSGNDVMAARATAGRSQGIADVTAIQ